MCRLLTEVSRAWLRNGGKVGILLLTVDACKAQMVRRSKGCTDEVTKERAIFQCCHGRTALSVLSFTHRCLPAAILNRDPGPGTRDPARSSIGGSRSHGLGVTSESGPESRVPE